MADSTLSAIQTKVRRLTRSLSEAQLTTTQINEYVNTFVLYDFPEHLRLFNLRKTFSFYTSPYVDVYSTNTTDRTNPLYDFKNKYITIHPPIYIAGYQALLSQSREQFFGIYPIINSIASIGVSGNGTKDSFSGTVNTQQANIPPNLNQQNVGLLQNNVLFSSVDASGNGLALIDSPIVDSSTGIPTVWGLLYPPNNPPTTLPLALAAPYNTQVLFPSTNYINYATGAFTITFPTAPGAGLPINSQTVPQGISLPQSVLFYNGEFTVRPIPDQPYKVNMEVYARPTEILAGEAPELQEWWQYIAYGASKKVFEDRMDMDSLQMIMPEFKMQERLILRRTLIQYSNERAATIYSQQTSSAGSYGPGNQWGGF